MAVVPAWFDDEFLGARIVQYLGLLALVVVAMVAQAVVMSAVSLTSSRRR